MTIDVPILELLFRVVFPCDLLTSNDTLDLTSEDTETVHADSVEADFDSVLLRTILNMTLDVRSF